MANAIQYIYLRKYIKMSGITIDESGFYSLENIRAEQALILELSSTVEPIPVGSKPEGQHITSFLKETSSTDIMCMCV